MMKDIFVCPNGNMLENWVKAFPRALVMSSLKAAPKDEPVLFWVHANVSDQAWLDQIMAALMQDFTMAKVVVLANTPNQTDALTVMTKGVVGYCHAYSDARTLKELKTVVMHGGLWLGQDLLKSLIGASKKVVHNSSVNVAHALNLLTAREKQVALLAAEALSNKEIARSLDISLRTVKAHMTSVLEKLGVKDRLQLALVLNERLENTRPLSGGAERNKAAFLKAENTANPSLN